MGRRLNFFLRTLNGLRVSLSYRLSVQVIPLECQSMLVMFGTAFVRIEEGIGMSILLEDKDESLQRSLQAIREACMVSGRCCKGNGFHTSRNSRKSKFKVGLRACSIQLQRMSGEGVVQFLG